LEDTSPLKLAPYFTPYPNHTVHCTIEASRYSEQGSIKIRQMILGGTHFFLPLLNSIHREEVIESPAAVALHCCRNSKAPFGSKAH
jgi:hypothetical protein